MESFRAQTLSPPRLSMRVEARRARVDRTATDPAKRIMPAELAMLTPDIPDTLILTEITGRQELDTGGVSQSAPARWLRRKIIPE